MDLVERQLENLSRIGLQGVAKKLKRPIEEIDEAYELIKSLNPRPGYGFSGDRPDYILPDLVLNSRSRSELAQHLQQLSHWQPDLTLRNNFFRYLEHVYCVAGKWAEGDERHFKAVNQRLMAQDLFAEHH